MEYEVLDDGRLSIPFVVERNNYVYSDAIVGEPEYINSLTDADIEAIKADRFDRWYKIVTTPQE